MSHTAASLQSERRRGRLRSLFDQRRGRDVEKSRLTTSTRVCTWVAPSPCSSSHVRPTESPHTLVSRWVDMPRHHVHVAHVATCGMDQKDGMGSFPEESEQPATRETRAQQQRSLPVIDAMASLSMSTSAHASSYMRMKVAGHPLRT